jgi:hypothetical protein
MAKQRFELRILMPDFSFQDRFGREKSCNHKAVWIGRNQHFRNAERLGTIGHSQINGTQKLTV